MWNNEAAVDVIERAEVGMFVVIKVDAKVKGHRALGPLEKEIPRPIGHGEGWWRGGCGPEGEAVTSFHGENGRRV